MPYLTTAVAAVQLLRGMSTAKRTRRLSAHVDVVPLCDAAG